MITKRRDTTQRDITLTTLFGCLLLLAGIWGIDGVRRLFVNLTGKNEINLEHPGQTAYILDVRGNSENSGGSENPENSGNYPDSENSQNPENPENPVYLDSGDTNSRGIQIAGVRLFDNPEIVKKSSEDIYQGTLLQIDAQHPFMGELNTLTTFENKNSYYRLKNMTLQAKSAVVDAMNELSEYYYKFCGRSDFLIYSTTEVYDVPGTLYPEILPDRASGFCIDLAFLNDDGSISQVTSQNNGWLIENAWRFGFVFSYTEANQSRTGVTPAPYHLRYVGKEHASVMNYNQLDLHTYLDLLRDYGTANSYQYNLDSDSNSINLEISYIPASTTGTTKIPIPGDGVQYSISGNNTDGFILCVSDPGT